MIGSGWAATRRRSASIQGIVLAVALVTFLVPLAWTALASLGVLPRGTYPPAFTGTPTLDHYVEVGVAEPGFWQELATSTGVAIAATLLTVAAAVLAGYALARSRFRGRRAVVQGFLILASLPVMAYAIPLGEEMRRLGLADTFPGLILGVAAVTSPLAVFVLFGQLGQLSVECGGGVARRRRPRSSALVGRPPAGPSRGRCDCDRRLRPGLEPAPGAAGGSERRCEDDPGRHDRLLHVRAGTRVADRRGRVSWSPSSR